MTSSARNNCKHPLVGVSAAIFHDDKVLLARRGHAPAKGLWSFPGGLVKKGERLDAAVRRELLEETGLSVSGLDHIDTIEIIGASDEAPRHHYILMLFTGKYERGEAKAGSDAVEICWVTAQEAAALPLTDGILAIIKRLTRC